MKEIPLAFKSHGKQIVGILHLSKKNSPCVIMCHGYGGDKLGNQKRVFVKAARYFSKNGISALRFDFLGCGDSEGDLIELTVSKQIVNLQDAITFLEKNVEVDSTRIGVMGWSRGSAICMLTATVDNRIKCVVSWAGESDFKDTWPNQILKEVKKRGIYKSFWYGYSITKASYTDEMKHDILKAVKKMKRPVLVIHGTNDDNVVLNQGENLYKAASKPKKIFVVKNADHSFNGFEGVVIKQTFLWFKRWLK